MRDLDLGPTVASARRTLAGAFRGEGLESPDLDARLLIGHALNLDHAALAATADRALTPAEKSTIARLALRRLAHEPVARIRGHKEFWGLDLRITEDVLVPRPDTETVVEAALAALGSDAKARIIHIADLGTGSGALLVALLHELPRASGVGTDVSERALAVARSNARLHGLGARSAFVACDYGSALAGNCDLVVSNPPYIPSKDIVGLPADVREYDPRAALDGGIDGLQAYRTIAADVNRLLRPGGTLVVEIGIGQGSAVSELFTKSGMLVASPPRRDLAGRERAVVAQRPNR